VTPYVLLLVPSVVVRFVRHSLSRTLSVLFFRRLRRAPSFILFPYTTLFRSEYSVQVSDDGNEWREAQRGELVSTFAPQKIETNRSEEHTSELQSPDHLVCRLLLEKKHNTDVALIDKRHGKVLEQEHHQTPSL